jgi:hypothetical protein
MSHGETFVTDWICRTASAHNARIEVQRGERIRDLLDSRFRGNDCEVALTME